MRKKKKEEKDKNYITVKFSRSTGRVVEYNLEGEEPTVEDLLKAADVTLTKGDRVRVNGELADEDVILEDEDMVVVSGKITGGTK